MAAVVPASLVLACAQVAHGCSTELAGATRIDAPRYTLAYRPLTAPIASGRHFSLEVAVCPKADAPAAATVEVEAVMPEHGHGMNYKAVVKRVGDGRFQADGLLLHMTGRWEFRFAVRGALAPERLTHSIIVD